MVLIIGLGNPGKEYAGTRHNFGFMVADALADSFNLDFFHEKRFQADMAELREHRHRIDHVYVAKPQTFMNLSGQTVSAIARFYKIEPKDIWVIADDLDLPLGKIRVRHWGETAGHHGLDSIAQTLNSNAFGRIRLGIRGQALRQWHLENKIDTNQFVMSRFEDREQPFVERSITLSIDILREALIQGELKSHTYEVEGLDTQAGDQPTS